MNRYRVAITFEFHVTAENVAQAYRVAQKISTVGTGAGCYRTSRHDKKLFHYISDAVSKVVKVLR
jgi:hypothetical protein